jgi:hypothetical protein
MELESRFLDSKILAAIVHLNNSASNRFENAPLVSSASSANSERTLSRAGWRHDVVSDNSAGQ